MIEKRDSPSPKIICWCNYIKLSYIGYKWLSGSYVIFTIALVFSCEYWEILKNTYFEEYLPAAAFAFYIIWKYQKTKDVAADSGVMNICGSDRLFYSRKFGLLCKSCKQKKGIAYVKDVE